MDRRQSPNIRAPTIVLESSSPAACAFGPCPTYCIAYRESVVRVSWRSRPQPKLGPFGRGRRQTGMSRRPRELGTRTALAISQRGDPAQADWGLRRTKVQPFPRDWSTVGRHYDPALKCRAAAKHPYGTRRRASSMIGSHLSIPSTPIRYANVLACNNLQAMPLTRAPE